MMKQYRKYVAPAILRETALAPAWQLMASSTVDQTTVVSTGQPVDNIEWSTDDFNHTWGD